MTRQVRVTVESSAGSLKDYEVTLADHGVHDVKAVVRRTRRLARGASIECYLRLVPPYGEVWQRAVAAAQEKD